MTAEHTLLTNACAKNRAEEMGVDVWTDFVIPLFYDKLDLLHTAKPRLIIGGRGCGKTMLLRYLSHYSSFSPNRLSIPDQAIREIGLYWKIDTYFLNLMAERAIPSDVWTSAFDHFVAIAASLEILRALKNVAVSNSPSISKTDLEGLVFSACRDFDTELNGDVDALATQLRKRERQFQLWVNNPRTLCPPLFLPGRHFVLTLLSEVREQLPTLSRSVFFLYIDEYENLREYQQRIINTYLKHSEPPFIFNIASKRNGMRTRQTVSEESITDIADYRTYDLDDYLLDHNFELFAAEVLFLRFATRTKVRHLPVVPEILQDPARLDLRRTAEYQASVLAAARHMLPSLSQHELAVGALADPSIRNQLERRTQVALKQHPNVKGTFIREGQPEASVIVPALLSRRSLKATEILDELDRLDRGELNRFSGRTNWIHNNFIGCLLQLYAPHNRACPFYAGFDTFIQLAAGNLRHFLELCHKSLKKATASEELASLQISPSDQAESAKQASTEFLREVRTFGRYGNKLHSFVLGLGTLFGLAHRRPSQSEPEINHFAVLGGISGLPETDIEFFTEAVKWSVLREEAATKVKDQLAPPSTDWVLAPIYAPYFHISYRKRRKLEFTVDEIQALINGDYGKRLLKHFADKWSLNLEEDQTPLFSTVDAEGV